MKNKGNNVSKTFNSISSQQIQQSKFYFHKLLSHIFRCITRTIAVAKYSHPYNDHMIYHFKRKSVIKLIIRNVVFITVVQLFGFNCNFYGFMFYV